MTQFKIPVIEYASDTGVPLALPPCPFSFNERQLIISMVRSILTVNSGKAPRKYMAAIVKPTLQFMIDWHRAPDLQVSSDFSKVFRDFSLTTRIGELAQGISFAYWKWQKGYLCISDFRPWAAGLSSPYVGKKFPDFVMFNPLDGDVAIMEAKGTGLDNHKQPMQRALLQCGSALPHLAVSRSYGSILTLDSESPTRKGTLHIRDPENIAHITDEMKYELFRRSYASWFDITGDDELANWCRQSKGGAGKLQTFNSDFKDSGRKLRAIISAAIGFDPTITSFKIDSEIQAALRDYDAFQRLDWNQLSQRMRMQGDQEQKLIRFPDGTSIVEG